MRPSAWALLYSVPSKTKLVHSRPIGDRLPITVHRRTFRSSLSRPSSKDDKSESSKAEISALVNEVGSIDEANVRQRQTFDGPENGPENGSEPSRPKDLNNYGSAARRARRNRTPREISPVNIPEWFLERNVSLVEEAADKPTALSTTSESKDEDSSRRPLISGEQEQHQDAEEHASELPSTKSNDTRKIELNDREGLETYESIVLEVTTMMRAGLRLSSPPVIEPATNKPHLLLCCPQPGGNRFLRDLVQKCARLSQQGADIVRLDLQDVSEIAGEYVDEPGRLQEHTLSSLSYEASVAPGQEPAQELSDEPEEEDFEEEDEEGSDPSANSSGLPRRISQFTSNRGSVGVGVGIIPIGSIMGNVQDALKSIGNPGGHFTPRLKLARDSNDNTSEQKLGAFMEALTATREIKRQHLSDESNQTASHAESTTASSDMETDTPISLDGLKQSTRDLIILVEDYPQFSFTSQGTKFMDRLHGYVESKRREGHKILIVGTASTKEVIPTNSKGGIHQAQANAGGGPTRTIIIPVKETLANQVLVEESKRKIRAINVRHLRSMLRRLAPIPSQVQSIADNWNLEINHEASFLVDIDDKVFTSDFAERIATMALGLKTSVEDLSVTHLETAMHVISDSDQQKTSWIKEEHDSEKSKKPKKINGRDSEEGFRKLRSKCNKHEKKLLNGVIDAANIKTTFADVRAPPETIEALKTLTSLSLIRPDAFTYGILAKNRIPGLLLYGPPGTGKTLLAKAVAKESGATMLEISGSDVYDMYVGEGEKNVRAIFSLAKKLAPCVIFMDEADAILGARGGASNRNSHRELINQFLREWDGMTEFNAFIMVATNRPFDLDEASLRRLPRRLLVDLPVEKDREAILKIHLQDEELDAGVSLSKLAADTPYYSGSDLKNLCVAAALACVREEVDGASTTVSKDSGNYRESDNRVKRVLASRHFTKAMEEISASISEDMRSLSAIRKFDEKYGDRKGRRKKLGAYGFKTNNASEKAGSDAARVRSS